MWTMAVVVPGILGEDLTEMPFAEDQHVIQALDQLHYNTARPHQGIAQRVPGDEPDAPRATVTSIGTQQVRRKPVLGGLINEYTHAA